MGFARSKKKSLVQDREEGRGRVEEWSWGKQVKYSSSVGGRNWTKEEMNPDERRRGSSRRKTQEMRSRRKEMRGFLTRK
jgi:hypothetical protein